MEPIILCFLNNHPAPHTKNALTQHSKNWKEKQSGVFRTKFSDDRLFAILLCNNIDQESIKLAAAQQFDCSGRCCCCCYTGRHPSSPSVPFDFIVVAVVFVVFVAKCSVSNQFRYLFNASLFPAISKHGMVRSATAAAAKIRRRIFLLCPKNRLDISRAANCGLRIARDSPAWLMDGRFIGTSASPPPLPLPLSLSLSFLFQIDRSTKLKIHFWNSFFSVC